DELRGALAKAPANGRRLLDRDSRAVDEDRRYLVGDADPVRTEIDLFQILAGRNDRKQHVDIGEIARLVDDLAAGLGKRFGLRAGAIPDRNVVAGLKQPLGHRKAHAAHSDPDDFFCLVRHPASPLTSFHMWLGYHSPPEP